MPVAKKKKPLAQIIAEKEERRRREAEERRAREEANRTPEDEQAEKLRRQRMQEEADLELAKEAFGAYATVWHSFLRTRSGFLTFCPSPRLADDSQMSPPVTVTSMPQM